MNRYVGAIEALALNNTYFRQVLFTSEHAQLVVMSLQPGEEIGDEVHPDVDQFFRIERGEAKFVFDDKDECLAHVNRSKTAPLKLYTIYSPPNHPDVTVHKTKLEAEAAEAAHA